MKVSILALFAAPALVLGSLAPQSGPAAVAHHHHNVARGVKAHPASHYHGKRGPAKAKRCAAKTASLSSASVSSTSVLAHQTTTTTTKKETTTKKPEEKPTTTTTHHTTTTTPKPKPTADKNDDDNNDDSGNDGGATGQTYTGDATFYSTGLNACGTYDSDDDFIAAVAHANFDSFPGANGNSNENPICNKKVKACYKGNCVTVRITDRCGGCNWGALDFSPSAFRQLADPDLGRLHGMTWNFI